MAFAIYLHRDNFQPESPLILDKSSHDPAVHFTCVDFVPSVIKRPTTVIPQCEVEYHSFSTMVEVANEWLVKNGHQWEVTNCETVIFLYKFNDATYCYELKPNDCCFYIYGSEKNNVLKALRLWIRRKPTTQDMTIVPHQVLRFRDVTPVKQGSHFEALDDLLSRFNQEMLDSGLAGSIITIESLAYEASKDWRIDTESSLSTLSTKNVFNIRVFYESTETITHPQIGIEDFFPNQLTRATFFKRPTFETFDKVIDRAFVWLHRQPSKRFINAQSIDIKMKSVNQVNSRQMAFTEHGNYMRIFRIAYCRLEEKRNNIPVQFATQMFLPYNKLATIADIKQRLSDWINQNLELTELHPEARQHSAIVSAETVEVFAKDFRNENIRDTEKAANTDTFLANRFGNKNAYMFFSLRIFYDTNLLPKTSRTNT